MQKAVVFLEPANSNFHVIRAAKDRGLYTIALSMNPAGLQSTRHPYSLNLSALDEVLEIDNWVDIDSVLYTLHKREGQLQVVGVYTSIDACLPCESRLRKNFGLPRNPDSMIAATSDKFTLRKRLVAAGVSSVKGPAQI